MAKIAFFSIDGLLRARPFHTLVSTGDYAKHGQVLDGYLSKFKNPDFKNIELALIREANPPKPFASSAAEEKTVKARGDWIWNQLKQRGIQLPHVIVSLRNWEPTTLAGAFVKGKVRGAKTVCFDFFPRKQHYDEFEKSDLWRQTLAGTVGHLSLLVKDEHAIITQIQGNASLRRGLDERVRRKYSYWQEALIEAAKKYCSENHLNLWLLDEHVYGLANAHAGSLYSYVKDHERLPLEVEPSQLLGLFHLPEQKISEHKDKFDRIVRAYAPFKQHALTPRRRRDPVFEKYPAYLIYRKP